MIGTIRDLQGGIDRHLRELEQRRLAAADAVREGEWVGALIAVGDCIGHEEAMEEMRHQIELAQIEIDTMLEDMEAESEDMEAGNEQR